MEKTYNIEEVKTIVKLNGLLKIIKLERNIKTAKNVELMFGVMAASELPQVTTDQELDETEIIATRKTSDEAYVVAYEMLNRYKKWENEELPTPD